MAKYFLDRIHGYIPICKDVVQIIHTPEFQRLKQIKQLGTVHYIFMGATHTRFEHSIGVSYLAGKLIECIKEKQPELNITNRDVLMIKIAGLCHDIGHGPFSHTFDNSFLKDHRSPWKEHEYRSIEIIKYIIKKYNLNYSQDEVDFICSLISNKNDSNRSKFMFQIVSNAISGLDCDKIDYLIRDTQSVGMESSLNYELLFNNARVIDDHICYPRTLTVEIYQLFHLRYVMHKRVYQHKSIKIISHMINDMLHDIDTRLFISNNVNDIEKFCTYTDNIIEIDSFYYKDTISSHILDRLNKRELYECIYYEVNKPSIGTKLPKLSNSVIVDSSRINFNSISHNPLSHIYYYDKYGDNNKKFKLDEYSMIVPNIFTEVVEMIIMREDNQEDKEKIMNVIFS